jgi:NADH-quinone oxidoreductase subunit N
MIALIVLVISAILTMFGSFVKIKNFTKSIAVLGVAAALAANIYEYYMHGSVNDSLRAISPIPMLYFGSFSLCFTGIMLFFTLLILLLSDCKEYHAKYPWSEFYALVLLSLCGAICMVAQTHLLMLFLGIEILSIPLYVLATSNKLNVYSNEAGLKYFLMGAFATGILLFGIALIYGTTGSLDFFRVNQLTESGEIFRISSLFWVGVVLMILAMLFKIAAVPFHFWSPDVYEGSPNIVTLYMATVVKTASIGCFLWLMYGFFGSIFGFWQFLLCIVAGMTLFVANITAVGQTSFKRMLSYSSISQVGYILIGFVAIGSSRAESGNIAYFLLAYGIASIALFAGIMAVSEKSGNNSFDAFNGLFEKNKFLAIAMLLATLSLAGIPLTAGFFGKFLILSSAIQAHLSLVIIALINSAISIYYYFKLIHAMFFKASSDHVPVKLSISYFFVLTVAISAIFLLCYKADVMAALLNQF